MRSTPRKNCRTSDRSTSSRPRQKGPLTDQVYLDALAKNRRLSRQEGIDAVMDRHRLDALVTPTREPPWAIDLVNGDHITGPTSSTPAALAGYPIVSVPAGYVFGRPVGISFLGTTIQRADTDSDRVRIRAGGTASAGRRAFSLLRLKGPKRTPRVFGCMNGALPARVSVQRRALVTNSDDSVS